jgi:hypothetical protein
MSAYALTQSGGGQQTLQLLNATGSITSWSTILDYGITTPTTNGVLTMPPCSTADIGKTITIKRNDGTAFTLATVPNGANTGEVTTPEALNSKYGSITLECTSATGYKQINNIGQTVLAEFGEVFAPSDVSTSLTNNTSAVSFISFTLPSAGVWEVDYIVRGSVGVNSGGNAHISSCLYDPSGTLIPNTEVLPIQLVNSNAATVVGFNTATGVARITTAGSATYSVRVYNSSSSGGTQTAVAGNTNGRSSVKWKKISGYSPVAFYTPSFVHATQGAGTFGASTAVTFGTIYGYGGITYSGGLFQLTGGVSYELDAVVGTISVSAAGYLTTVWQTSSGVALAASAVETLSFPVTGTYSESSTNLTKVIYTPTVDTQVKLVATGTGTGSIYPQRTWATIKQIGGKAVTTTPISVLQLDNTTATAQAATTVAAGTGTGILWYTPMFTKGNKISFTQNSGAVTLAGGTNGTTYRLTGKVATTSASDASGSYVFYRFYNVTTSTLLGSEGYSVDPDAGVGSGAGWNEIPSPTAYAYITVPAGTTQQIRMAIVNNSATPGTLRQYNGQTSCTIEEIEG